MEGYLVFAGDGLVDTEAILSLGLVNDPELQEQVAQENAR